MKKFFVFLLMVYTYTVFGGWNEDYEAAYKRAKTFNKNIVLYFTGSDWCPWCKKLKNDILDKDDFFHLTDNYFEFVEIDFPAKEKLSDKQYQDNKKLKEKYGVEGFPTIIIIDLDGNVIAKTGYSPISSKEYAQKLIKWSEAHNSVKKKRFK